MTDDPNGETTYGLGAIASPNDPRDWPVSLAYATLGIDRPEDSTLPATYRAPTPYPPILNQGSTPMCVAYSNASVRMWEDLRDQGAFVPDEPLFFSRIGGTANGAVPRVALDQLLNVGYPVAGAAGDAGKHKIAAYYAVPLVQADIQAAIMALGPILLGTRWYNSWFRPVNGVLPAPDTEVGGHEIMADGWNEHGLELVNSWGPGWSVGGRVTMPWAYVLKADEAWKTVDVIDAPPPPKPKPITWTLHVAHNALIHIAHVRGGVIVGWQTRSWPGNPSSAPCGRPAVWKGAIRGQATLVLVTAGVFKGQYVKVDPVHGVTVTHS